MLSIDGIHLENDLGLHLLQSSQEPILPATRDHTVTIPGRHGSYSFPGYVTERKFFQDILIPTQSDIGDVQSIVRSVSELLLDEYGKPKEVELRWDYEPDKYYKAKFAGEISIQRIHHAGIFAIPFTAHDPYAYASANEYDPEEDYMYGEVNTDEEELYYKNTPSFEWQYERHYSGIHNYSYYATDFIIEIGGTVDNPSITNLKTNKTLTLPSISNGKLEINSKNYTIVKDGSNGFSQSNRQFFDIPSGDVGFLFEGKNPNATVTYKWKHKFM